MAWDGVTPIGKFASPLGGVEGKEAQVIRFGNYWSTKPTTL
jgi:hypothetical protein